MKSWKMKLFKCKHAGINGECNNPLVPSSQCKNVMIADCPDKYAWIISEFNKPECKYCLKGSLVSGRTEFNCHVVAPFCADYCTKAQRAMKFDKFKKNNPMRYAFFKFAYNVFAEPTIEKFFFLILIGLVVSLPVAFFLKISSIMRYAIIMPAVTFFILLPLMMNGLAEAMDEDMYYLTKLEQEYDR